MADPKYLSLLNLMETLKSQWMHKSFFEQDDGMKEVKKGGVLILQTLENAIVTEFNTRHQSRQEEQDMAGVLNGLGWGKNE